MLTKPISNITPFTLLDFPHKSACILWYAGCNMRCLYCYNPEIVLGKGTLHFDEVLQFLNKRKGLLDAVVFSGGECTIHKNIYEQIKQVKAMGFAVKVDTNGSKPELIKKLINENLIDYVALDFKALPKNFNEITQSKLFAPFEKSFQILQKSNLPFEARTTYHSELFFDNDMNNMIQYLEKNDYKGNYYIQNFRNYVETLGQLSYATSLKLDKLKKPKGFEIVVRN